MKTVTLTEFRSQASGMLSEVENGETLIVLRHGRPIAQVLPVADGNTETPSWKKLGAPLVIKGEGLSKAILEERDS